MWTYRPAEITPIQHNKEFHSAAKHPEQSRPQPSSAAFSAQAGTTPRQAAFKEEKHRQRSGYAPQKVAEASVATQKLHFTAQTKPSRMLRSACMMGSLYLTGLAAGALCSRLLSEPLLTYARYFASIDLGLRTAGNAAMVFSTGFLSLFCQLTLVLIAGFCVLGIGLIPVTMLLKGAGAGVFTALLYQQLGPVKGLLLQALVFWLPETLGSLIAVVLSASALQVSCGLLRCCLGQTSAGLGAVSRRLVHRYLALCFVSMLVCGLSVILTLVFGSLF